MRYEAHPFLHPHCFPEHNSGNAKINLQETMTDTDIILYLTVSTTALFLTTICFFAMYVLKRNEANSHKSLFPSYEKRIEALGEFKSKCVAAMAESAELKLWLQKSEDYIKDLQKMFIEQSQLATSWKQKYDEEKEFVDGKKEYLNRTAASWNKLSNEVILLEAELDRGNEMISWLKADLKRAYDLLFQNEKVILELIMRGKFPDEKGNYKVYRLSRNGVTFEAGEYLHSLYESKIAQQQLEHKNKSEHKSKEKRPKGWNLKVAPRDKAGRVMKMSERVVLEPIDIKEGVIENLPTGGQLMMSMAKSAYELHDEKQTPKPVRHLREVNEEVASKNEIDWSVPQPFTERYKIPIGTKCITLKNDDWGSYIIPKGTKVKVLGYNKKASNTPFVEVLEGQHRKESIDESEGGYIDGCMTYYGLAPIDPTNHPLHPEFKEKK